MDRTKIKISFKSKNQMQVLMITRLHYYNNRHVATSLVFEIQGRQYKRYIEIMQARAYEQMMDNWYYY